jgi:hypothetical protein
MTITEMKKWKDRAKKCSEIYKNAGKDLDKAKVTIPVGAFEDLVNTAIKSLEAWGKVKKEIDDSISVCESDAMRDTWCDGELAGFLQCKDIINRNLSEVSE